LSLTKYQHVLAEVMKRLHSGEWPVGAKIPSGRALAQDFGCCAVTIERVVRTLMDDGMLRRESRKGTYVAPREQWHRQQAASPQRRLIGVMTEFPYIDLQQIDATLRERNYAMVVRHTHDHIDTALQAIHEFSQLGVSGILWSPLSTSNHRADNALLADAILASRLPSVAIDRYPEDVEVQYVVSDNAQAGYTLTKYLLDLGHRRIGLVRHIHGSTPDDRHRGYTRALRAAGIDANDNLVFTIGHEVNTQEVITRLRAWLRAIRPTAAWAIAGYPLGNALLAAAQAEGLHIPDDLSIASFDEIIAPFPMTSIMQPFEQMAYRAATLLCDQIEHPTDELYRIVLRSTLRVGASCAPPAADPIVR